MGLMGSGSKKPSLAIVIGGKGHGDSEEEEAPASSDDDSDVLGVSDDEVEAVKAFDAAKSPEEKAKALKAFIKICEGY